MKIKPGKEAEYASFKQENDKIGRNVAVINYAERWAEKMEQEINAGASVAEAAIRTRYDANEENLSWFMYGNAVRVLAHFWSRGDELRQCQQQSDQSSQIKQDFPKSYQAYDAQGMS